MLSRKEISNALRPVFKKYNIQKAIIFGSFAKEGEVTKRSDLDLVLIKETKQRFFDRYQGLYKDVYDTLKPLQIDLLIYTPGELKNISHRKFIKRILEEGIVIYEQRKVAV